jgi:hypothetical protein
MAPEFRFMPQRHFEVETGFSAVMGEIPAEARMTW